MEAPREGYTTLPRKFRKTDADCHSVFQTCQNMHKLINTKAVQLHPARKVTTQEVRYVPFVSLCSFCPRNISSRPNFCPHDNNPRYGIMFLSAGQRSIRVQAGLTMVPAVVCSRRLCGAQPTELVRSGHF